MQWKYLSVIPLVLLSVGLGALLIPRESEIALMSLKAKRFNAAEPFYADQRQQGDQSVGTIASLTEIYLNDGRIDAAIVVLEELLVTQPDSLDVRRFLGKLYGDAQRLDDYARNLQSLNDLAPSEGQLRELIDIYDRSGAFDREIAARRAVIAAYDGTPQDFHRLALLLADRGALADAASTLHGVALEKPDLLDPDMRTLLFRLLIDTGATDTAGALAQDWVTAGVSTDEVQYFTDEMLTRGRVDEASAIFAPYMSAAANDPVLQPLLLNLLIARGETAEAVALLENWFESGQLTADGLAQYVSLALASGAVALAEVLTAGDNLRDMPVDLLSQIVDDAFGQGAFAVVSQAGGQFADADLAQRPLVGAKIAIAQGDMRAAAQWAAIARRTSGRSSLATIELAEILVLLDEKTEALTLLDDLVGQDDVPSEAYGILARLYIDQARAEAGFAKFTELRAGRPSGFDDAAWALLAAQTGRDALVLAWLETGPRVHADDLEDIVAAALVTGADGLALAAAESLYALKDGAPERLLFAEALLRVGRAAQALEHLRPLVADIPEAEVAYVKALQAVGAREELTTFLALKEGSAADGLAQNDLIYDLLEGEEIPDYLLPFVERLARDVGGDWLYTYAELAQRAQRTNQLVGFLEAEMSRSGLPSKAAEERLSLLAQIAPERALVVAERLAEQSPRQWSPLYTDLLQTLGDTGRMQAAIARRLADQDAPIEEIEAMAYALIESGDLQATLPATRLLAEKKGGDWLFTYAELATKAGRGAELADFLATEIRRRDLDEAAVTDRVDLLITAAPQAAVVALRPFVEQDPKRWFAPYFELLQKQGDVDGVTQLVEQRLASKDVPREQLEGLTYALINAKNLDSALPSVRRMAETLGGDWTFTYVDLARRAERKGDAINLLNHQLNRKDLSKAAFDDLVSLLITTDPVVAVAILKHHAKADGGLWYDAYTEALLTVRPRYRQFASSLKAMESLASSVGGPWLQAYAEKARKENREADFIEFLAQQRSRTDLEPANAEIIAQMWSESQP